MERRETGLAAFAFVISAVVMAPAQAQQQEVQQEQHQISYNAAVVSDYRYRGVSQSRLDPALQAGADYTHNPTGLYAGTWLSSIRWTKDGGGSGDVEWDLYGGKRGDLGNDISYDVGGLYYFYPSNGLNPSANTFELYSQLGYGPAYVKYSYSFTNLFGTPDSKHSGYLDIGANVDMAKLYKGLVLNLHVGRQEVLRHRALSYTDYKLGFTQDFGVASLGLAYVRASTEAYRSPGGQNLGRGAGLLTVSKTF